MSKFNATEIDDRDELADLDCDYGYQPEDDGRWEFEVEQFELFLESLGGSDECWLATDEDRDAYETWAREEGFLPRAA